MTRWNRRLLVSAGLLALTRMACSAAADVPAFFHNEGCGCCHGWAEHMARAGLPVKLVATPDLSGEYARHGVPHQFESCHVGKIAGYVISGHVPPDDIFRLLDSRPAAAGLIVPGMPVGSPGMEYDGQTEPYDVLLLDRDGSTSVFSRHS